MRDTEKVTAVWYDGKSAAEHQVTVFFRQTTGELRICSLDSVHEMSALSVWKLKSIRLLSGKLGDHSQPLIFGQEPDDGQRLQLSEPLDTLIASKWLEKPLSQTKKGRLRRWMLVTILVWALCLSLFFGSYFIFSTLARQIPARWEKSLGESSRNRVVEMLQRWPATGTRGICAEGTNSADMKALMGRLTAERGSDGYVFDLVVLDADFVNAFAMPGGYMLVTTGLIRHCESPDELAGVLAHEMAHVTERHSTGGMLREYVWGIMLHMLGLGDNTVGSLAQTMLSSSFSREDERTADLIGVERLMDAGINPAGMASFFGRLASEEGGLMRYGFMNYISSHPPLEERRQSIGEKAQTYGGDDKKSKPYSPAMDAEAWERLRGLCPKTPKQDTDERKAVPEHAA